MFIIVVVWLGCDRPSGLQFFVPALVFSILRPLFLTSSFVSLSYFILVVHMHECLGKHSCMSFSFAIAILNAAFLFRSVRATNTSKLSATKPISRLYCHYFWTWDVPRSYIPVYIYTHRNIYSRSYIYIYWQQTNCSQLTRERSRVHPTKDEHPAWGQKHACIDHETKDYPCYARGWSLLVHNV